MEVHHHTHHPKKWKEYFWEFFMLFLAVFCGFLAELQLEHYIESQREKKYITHLMQDLSKDSANLHKYSIDVQRRIERIDTLLQLLVSNELSSKGNDLYYFARILVRAPNFFPSDASILQLKYSGNYRLIQHTSLVNQIGSFENQMREFTATLSLWDEQNIKYTETLEKIFDGKVFYRMLDARNIISKPTDNPSLISANENTINGLIIQLQFLKGGSLRNLNLSKKVMSLCADLQKEIRRKYKID